MRKKRFPFEELAIWQKAVDLSVKVIDVTENIQSNRAHYRLIENVEASVASVASNIAEGKGRYSKREFIQYLYIARGSLYETLTHLYVFQKKQWISVVQLEEIEDLADEVNKMLSSLILYVRRSISRNP